MNAKQKLLSLIGYASEKDCEILLKFFNEASNESLSVRENEAQKEVCSNKVMSSHNLDIAHYGVCTSCGGTNYEQTE